MSSVGPETESIAFTRSTAACSAGGAAPRPPRGTTLAFCHSGWRASWISLSQRSSRLKSSLAKSVSRNDDSMSVSGGQEDASEEEAERSAGAGACGRGWAGPPEAPSRAREAEEEEEERELPEVPSRP